MKSIQGSSRGRGSGYRGRGGGRGGGRGRGGRGGGGGGGKSDSRFASRFTDPRFQLSDRVNQRSQRRHNPRDEMEEAARTDPRFSKHLSKQVEEEEEEDYEESVEPTSEDASDEEQMHQGEEEEEIDPEEAELLDDDVNAWAPEDVEYTEARRRVAIVNCDWDHIRAVDLYAILFHALPLGGQLMDVCVYMSDFGKKMIEHERVHGPDLWVKPGDEDVAGGEEGDAADQNQIVEEIPDEDEEEDAASEARSDGWNDDDANMLQDQGEDGELFSSGKFRKYEMDRMKYYYAVATFDSAETAAAVYDELDGMDIEASGVVLDLRYVDDEDTFENPVSRADCIPPRFKPAGSFHSAALTQTRFRISWDQDDVFRHHSVQDSFTGTSAEDDLAAYLAPPDSDDDETDTRTGRSKTEEKLRIRRRYASLLEEIGGLPDEMERDSGDEDEDDKKPLGSDGNSSDDDDSLNRFSDVEMDSDNDGDDDRSVGSIDGDEMEATLDLDADSKAVGLQREARLRHKLKDGDLGAQAELKYKLRRKEMKKAKKEMIMQSREDEKEALSAQRDADKKKLKALIGTDDDGAVHLSGKERRKEHAKKVKQRIAEERVAKKQSRIASQFGVSAEQQQQQKSEAAVEAIDSRFQSKLLSDPRFHLEVAQKDKRISDDVVQLAATVAMARKGKRSREQPAASAPSSAASAPAQKKSVGEVDNAVDYFLSNPSKKKRRA